MFTGVVLTTYNVDKREGEKGTRGRGRKGQDHAVHVSIGVVGGGHYAFSLHIKLF
jgi:hypothetical protein